MSVVHCTEVQRTSASVAELCSVTYLRVLWFLDPHTYVFGNYFSKGSEIEAKSHLPHYKGVYMH